MHLNQRQRPAALTTFIRQCLAADEAIAGDGFWAAISPGVVEASGYDPNDPDNHSSDFLVKAPRPVADHMVRFDPTRVRAEVEAKRRIVDTYEELHHNPDRLTDLAVHMAWYLLGNVVRDLARVYADHPDYRQVVLRGH